MGNLSRYATGGVTYQQEQRSNGKVNRYSYGPDGRVVEASLGNQFVQYVYNAQGDVVMLLDDRGYVLVEYTYDAWGNITVTGDTTLAKTNPFTYRGAYGYYYDWETGLYYLQSRYYNPQVCRFINADAQLNDDQSVLGASLFTYCENNPVSNLDPTGYKSGTTFEKFGFYFSNQLPAKSYYGVSIRGVGRKENWAITTGAYTRGCKNHCGQTALTNLALLFAARGYGALKVNGLVGDTFKAVIRMMDDGMTTRLKSWAVKFFGQRGFKLKSADASSGWDIRRAIDKGRPVSLLLAAELGKWHWVICAGYRVYSDGTIYYRIIDGWHNTSYVYYKCLGGATLISGTQYWM